MRLRQPRVTEAARREREPAATSSGAAWRARKDAGRFKEWSEETA